MSTQSDGGPAFPTVSASVHMPHHGMSLRDWFAGMAITMVGDRCGSDPLLAGEQPPDKYARQCYRMADAMLAARERKEDA